MKNLNKKLPQRLNITYIHVINNFGIIKACKKITKTLSKKLAKKNLIYRNIYHENYKSDEKDLERW